jgi:hypothetical protein
MAILLDVKDRSAEAAPLAALDWLASAHEVRTLQIFAVGDWSAIAKESARTLVRRGAILVQSVPGSRLKDRRNLSLAVAAGVWLAGAAPGDQLVVVSDDLALEAVGDAAAVVGISFRHLGYAHRPATAETTYRHERMPTADRRRPRNAAT